VEEARRELGKPYQYGGSGPGSFDCSGLTAWAWGHAGHPLPHSAAAQYDVTTHIPISALQPGDLVFFGSPPHHVGIYVGGGQMINALHSGTNVEYDSIYMEGDLIGGGRVN
jgi:cell wall-associated NlpC family hydrolase